MRLLPLLLLTACGGTSLGSWSEPHLWIEADGDNGLLADGCRQLSPNVQASLSNSPQVEFEYVQTTPHVDGGCDGPRFNRIGGSVEVGPQTLTWTDGRTTFSMEVTDLSTEREWTIIAPTGGHPNLGTDLVIDWNFDSDTLEVLDVWIERDDESSAATDWTLDGTTLTIPVDNDPTFFRVNAEVAYSREVLCSGSFCSSTEVLLDGWDIR